MPAMARSEARAGGPEAGRRFLQLLQAAGALTDDERRRLSVPPPAPVLDGDSVRGLEEDDHELIAHPEAFVLAPVFAALWEGSAPSFGGGAPDLASLGVKPEDRISPVQKTSLATAYSACALALGNRKTALYVTSRAADGQVTLVPAPPTAIVAGPALADRPLAELRFLLGRALELARPEYVLAEALPPEAFTRLFASVLRAYHPRFSRRRLDNTDARDDEAARLRRALPYKVAKRLAELLTARADTPFSSAQWRAAVRHTGNRAGLVACNDVTAAARVLDAEGDPEAFRELARFAVSDDYVVLRRKLSAK
jgi:hypothetical protein